MNFVRPFSITLIKIFYAYHGQFVLIVMSKFVCLPFQCLPKVFSLIELGFIKPVISQSDFVSSTDNLSVPQTMDYSVNPSFAKLVSSTYNSSTSKVSIVSSGSILPAVPLGGCWMTSKCLSVSLLSAVSMSDVSA